ncbi:MAG: copper resistance protein CopC [Actinomycetota bacterium]
MRKTLAAMAIAIISTLSMLSTGSALANSLTSTTPVIGSTVTSSPSAITIKTTDAVMDVGNSVVVTDPQGGRVDDGTLTVSGKNIIAGMKLLTVSGVYTVSYTFLTDNDVPLEGTFTFTFKSQGVVSSTSPSPVVVTPTISSTPVSSGGAPALIVGLLMSAFVVFVLLCLYAWKLIKNR